jgi:hypothetical protein
MGASTTDKVIGSVQNLEYSIADALNKVTTDKQKTIAGLKEMGATRCSQLNSCCK